MRVFKLLSIFGLFCFSVLLQAGLSSQIDNLLATQGRGIQTGVYVLNADTGKILYNEDGINLMTPASNTKVLTAAAAFLYLGPNYQFITKVSTNGTLAGKVLNGNLYVSFSGDPSLSIQDVYGLMKALKAKGIDSIHGNVILDESVFSGPYYGLGWPQDDLAYCYAAPVAGSIINENCMALQVHMNKKGKPAVQQYTTNFPVVNQLQLVGKSALRTCVFQPTITSNNSILLQGCLPRRANWGFAFAIKNPQSYARQVVQVGLAKAGIAITGKVSMGKTPGKTTLLASHASKNLQALLSYMLKRSDNVYAGAMTKLLGSAYYGVGSYKGGANAIIAILGGRIGTSFKPPYLEDGSGESEYNLISPQQLTQVYRYMYAQPQLINTFMKSLVISGQRGGTLSYRLTKNGLAGHVFGKTGTINSVSTLSGYLDLPGKPTIIFAIMMNGVARNFNHARYVQDQIVQTIASNI